MQPLGEESCNCALITKENRNMDSMAQDQRHGSAKQAFKGVES